MEQHIHPVFERMLSREERQQRLGQRGAVCWLTGLSGSGKSTIAIGVERALFEAGFFAQLLDGDNIRSGINNNLGFSLEDRAENIRRIAEVAKLYAHSGLIVLCAFISPTDEMRRAAQTIIGQDDFLEIFIDTPLEVCEARDVKGLYAKARQGLIKGFTGIDSPYEPPTDAFLRLTTVDKTVAQCVQEVVAAIYPRIQLS